MKLKLIFSFLVLSLISNAQNKESGVKIENAKQVVEINISREKLLKAKNMKDIITDIPADCKVHNYQINSMAKNGSKPIFSQVGADVDIQKIIDTKKCKVIYVKVSSACSESHKPDYKIKVE